MGHPQPVSAVIDSGPVGRTFPRHDGYALLRDVSNRYAADLDFRTEVDRAAASARALVRVQAGWQDPARLAAAIALLLAERR